MGFIGYDGASLSVKLVWYIALFLRFENPLDMRMLVTINSHGDDLPLSIWQIFLIIYKMAVTRLTLRVLRIFPSIQIIRIDEILYLVRWLRISVWEKAESIICWAESIRRLENSCVDSTCKNPCKKYLVSTCSVIIQALLLPFITLK